MKGLLKRPALTPARLAVAFVAAVSASALTGTAVNLVALREAVRAPVVAATPAPPSTPAPPKPVGTVRPPKLPATPRPAPTPRTIVRRAYARQAAMAVPSPRRVQYENTVTLHEAGRTVTLPTHTGTVSVVLEVTLKVEAGATLSWDPNADMGATAVPYWVYAESDVPAEDAAHDVQLWGTGNTTPTTPDIRSLNPVAYIPEQLELPLKIRNRTSRAARVYLRVGLNTDESGGGGGTPDF